MEAGNWCLIESDPGVFTELIREIGVQGVQVEELWALDETLLQELKPVYGLIFLFKWQKELMERKPASYNPNLFFANQVINNACATQAILSILLNANNVELGEELSNFKAFTQDFTPELRGVAISNSDKIRTVHNSFARPESFSIEDKSGGSDEDVYHFIAYIPKDGKLWELDGLQEGPIDLGDATEENWLQIVTPIIQQRIERYTSTEIRFNLMAVVQDQTIALNKKIAELEQTKAAIIQTSGENSEELNVIQSNIYELRLKLENEAEKAERYKIENKRRRHNFIPLIINMLKALSEMNQLEPLVAKAKQTIAEKNQRKNKM